MSLTVHNRLEYDARYPLALLGSLPSRKDIHMPQEPATFSAALSDSLAYLLYVPRAYEPRADKHWPLILFLHGAGERGHDLEIIRKHGIPKIAAERDLPFLAISPQCPTNTWWPEHAGTLIQLVDRTIASHLVDPTRVYLTGLSMGGFGTWHLAACYPERFAAIAPICGGGYWFHGFPERVADLRGVPVWAFHGAQDQTVPPQDTQELVETLRKAGGDVRLTIYPDAAHDAWTRTYDNPALYEWFLSHTTSRGMGG